LGGRAVKDPYIVSVLGTRTRGKESEEYIIEEDKERVRVVSTVSVHRE
jgi:hypothetical protein